MQNDLDLEREITPPDDLLLWEVEEIVLSTPRMGNWPTTLDPEDLRPVVRIGDSDVYISFRDLQPGLLGSEEESRHYENIGYDRLDRFTEELTLLGFKKNIDWAIIYPKGTVDGREWYLRISGEKLRPIQEQILQTRKAYERENLIPPEHKEPLQASAHPELSRLIEGYPSKRDSTARIRN